MKNTLTTAQAIRLVRWTFYGICVVLFAVFISQVILPSYIKKTVGQQVAAQIGRPLTISDVDFNPFTLTVWLSGLVLYEADNKTRDFSADELILKISPSSLFRLAPVIREVVLKHPVLKLVRKQREGKEENNFSDVITHLAAHPDKGEPLRFSISNIQLIDGAIQFDDQVVGKKIHIEAINIGLPFLSNFSSAVDTFVEPGLSANVDGNLVELRGRSKPFSDSYETSLAINFNHIDLVPLLAFSPKPLPFKVNSAKLSSQLSLNFVMKKNAANVTLSGGATLNDVVLSDFADAPLLKTKSIHVSLQEANLTTKKVALNLLEIVEPQLWAGLNQQGQLNWLAALHSDTEEKSSPEKAIAAVKPILDLAHFKLKNGTVHWSDAANATPTMEMTLNKLNVDAQKISTNEKAAPGKLKIEFGNEHQPQASFVGVVDPAHQAVSGQLTLSDFALADYQPYFNRYLTANASGKLALKTQLAVLNGNIKLNEFAGAIEELKLKATRDESKQASGGSSEIVAKRIAIENASVDSELKQAKVEQVVLDRVQGDVYRDADGAVNLIHFLKKNANTAYAGNAKVSDGKVVSAPTKAPAWHAEIDQIALTNSNFVFSDKSKKPEVNIRADGMDAKLEQVSSNFDHPFKMTMSANLNSKGKIAVEGVVAEKNAQLKVDLQNFSVVVLQPYFTDLLNITLEKGAVSVKGQLDWIAPKEISYKGVLQLVNFSSSDKETSDSFLRWKTVNIAGVDVGFGAKQQKVTLGKIDVSDFYARAILSEQGKLNLENIIVHEHAGSPVTPGTNVTTNKEAAQLSASKNAVQSAIAGAQKNTENPPVPVINIGQINLNNGIVNYTDNFIKPHFSMRMTGMKGTIGTIQSTEAKAAPVNLHGKIDNDAPIVISGSLNPLFNPMLLDIKMTATGIDLPRLTAYSAKYAGYPIEKGKLSLDVEYHIKDNKLTANNTLKIDQLTFGKKVDSPNATRLPILLVVDLLSDRNGRINLEVPVSGTLDDPEFSVGSVIMKVILNLIGKVITSPFSLLAHSVSGAGELSYVEFASGSAKLTDAIKVKLDSLAKALEEHPNLKLDIIGRADLNGDAPGFRERKLNRQIKKMHERNEVEDNNALISDRDRESAVWKIYSNAKFDKPRNLIGLTKVQPVAEMEKSIMENTPVSDDDLTALATRRASAVRTYLTETAYVPPERMYTIAPKISGGDTNDKNADKGVLTRVDFDLKM